MNHLQISRVAPTSTEGKKGGSKSHNSADLFFIANVNFSSTKHVDGSFSQWLTEGLFDILPPKSDQKSFFVSLLFSAWSSDHKLRMQRSGQSETRFLGAACFWLQSNLLPLNPQRQRICWNQWKSNTRRKHYLQEIGEIRKWHFQSWNPSGKKPQASQV